MALISAGSACVHQGTGDTARLFQSLKDNVEEFVQMAIQEFLTNKGFKRTLVAFQNEQQTVRGWVRCLPH